MKKSLKKLALNRETLRSLEDSVIQEAVGGISLRTCGSPCSATCSVDPCYGPSDRCSYTYPCTK